MKALLTTLAASAAPLAPAFAQTDVLVRFDHPGGPQFGWGNALVAVGDLDGDGGDDLVVGTFGHGGGETGTVHSGRTGAALFTLQAPFGPLFFGDAFVPLADETGDGRPEIAAIGSHSGDANSPEGKLLVHSGADGSVLRELIPPAGYTVHSHTQGRDYSPGDVDGDGFDDILCRTTLVPGGGQVAVTLLSGQTARPIYSVAPLPPALIVGNLMVRVSDHDGDGRDDFATAVRDQGVGRVEIRSSATGALITQFTGAGLEQLTGNGEPFVSIADLDGDGLRDIATGLVFSGGVTLYSSSDGTVLRSWSCELPPAGCFGNQLIEVGDMDGNGQPDLVAVETDQTGTGGARVFGLDPTQKALLFRESIPDLIGGYSFSQRLIPLPGGDRQGAPTFAVFEELAKQVAVRRFVPRFEVR